MKYQLIPLDNRDPACLGFDDDYLYISSQNVYAAFEDLKAQAWAFRKSGHNGHKVIALEDIREINFNERVSDYFVRYINAKDKLRKYYFRTKEDQLRILFCKELAKACDLNTKSEKRDRFAQFGLNSMFLILTAFVTWAVVYFSGEEETHSRKALVQLFTQIVHLLGPTVCSSIGIAIAAFFLFRISRNLIAPSKTIKYHKL